MDSLALRLGVGITLLVVVPLAVVFLVLLSHQYDEAVDARRRSAELEGTLLEATLRHQMIDRDSRLMADVLAEIGQAPDVKLAMVIDHQGVIRVASDPAMVGQAIRRDSPTCRVCHDQSAEDRDRWVILSGTDTLRSVRPIENRGRCHVCHDPSQRFNGMMVLDLSLDALNARLRRDGTALAVGMGLLALLLLVGISLLVKRLILVRLNRLSHAARGIAAGHLGERAAVEGNDRIARLARDFNGMAVAIDGLITEVRGREAQLSSVMDSLDDGLVVLDRDLRVVGANRSFGRMAAADDDAAPLAGHRCCDLTDRTLCGCPGPEDCLAQLCIETGRVQHTVFRSGGEGENRRVQEVHASPIRDATGAVTQVVEIWRDISERVKEEERLGEIERLVSLGVLASGFSHEINTPLASVLICAESVLAQVGEASADPLLGRVRDSAATIRREVLRCRKITEQFLRFARGIPPSIEPIDLRTVAAGLVALVEPTAREARVTVTLHDGGPVPTVTANTEVVQHVVLNLLINAIQSCIGRGGTVDVTLQAAPEVRLRICDTGCGIPPEARRHLFEPFQTHKPGGTGLGLFLSRTFMLRFGGDVRLVETEVGAGSCFEVVFPAAEVSHAHGTD